MANTSQAFPHSIRITGFVTKLTRRVPLIEQGLSTLPEHLSSHPVLVSFFVWSLVVCVCFVDRCLSFFSFFFLSLCCQFLRILITPLISYGFWLPPFDILRILITPLISYGFWLPLWYLTDSDYPFDILRILITPLISYGFWLPLWYLQTLHRFVFIYILYLQILEWNTYNCLCR